jgi:hypothetical protein
MKRILGPAILALMLSATVMTAQNAQTLRPAMSSPFKWAQAAQAEPLVLMEAIAGSTLPPLLHLLSVQRVELERH